jgi:hypothetical protein
MKTVNDDAERQLMIQDFEEYIRQGEVKYRIDSEVVDKQIPPFGRNDSGIGGGIGENRNGFAVSILPSLSSVAHTVISTEGRNLNYSEVVDKQIPPFGRNDSGIGVTIGENLIIIRKENING